VKDVSDEDRLVLVKRWSETTIRVRQTECTCGDTPAIARHSIMRETKRHHTEAWITTSGLETFEASAVEEGNGVEVLETVLNCERCSQDPYEEVDLLSRVVRDLSTTVEVRP